MEAWCRTRGGGCAGLIDIAIEYDPTYEHAPVALAHEMGHALLAVARGGPVGVGYRNSGRKAEELAAWAVAQAITPARLWTRGALAFMDYCLSTYGVQESDRNPTIPAPLTTDVLRWLAQPGS